MRTYRKWKRAVGNFAGRLFAVKPILVLLISLPGVTPDAFATPIPEVTVSAGNDPDQPAVVAQGAPVDAAMVIEELQALVLLPSAGRVVSGLTLRVGPATLTLEEGELFPCTDVAGRAVQFVFVGSGRLESPAPDEIEAGQLELFTGRDHLDLEFHEAVLLAAGDTVGAALRGSGSSSAADTSPSVGRAREVLESWQASTDRKLLAPGPPLFLDAMGDRLLPERPIPGATWQRPTSSTIRSP